ncbi:FtsX-like permease family protein [Alkalinema sp. FACHB-956]|uniref:ABC transporter permease n=1 Tax=Alkalinema sp. FACHB-956 TaxID=2692768 RepID=UPI00168460D2|nr:FtsX-like permease family protein [Alkalinema sp. FACHB-956]MBD2329187.1 FtsX-like permease family protein [Alkalinema sp. FACHB-956]
MKSLDRKLMRDLWRLRGQVIAIALIVACGLASFVAMTGTYEALQLTQANYYEQYRLADVFASVKRAPESLVSTIAAIPGVAQVQTRVVAEVNLDLPDRREPSSARLISIPAEQQPILNDLYLRQGRYIDPSHRDEVIISEAFALANHLSLGDDLGAVINGRWQTLQIVGLALSPEYIYEIKPGAVFSDNRYFGVMWMERDAIAQAFDMKGAFNDVAVSLLPQAVLEDVMFQLDQVLAQYGGITAIARKDQLSNRFITEEIRQLWTHAVTLPTIFLGIGAFLLHMVLTRLISTQREQIAILKAFGYSHGAIGWHFLKFVLVIVALGVALGTGVGIWLGGGLIKLYTEFYRFPELQYQLSPLRQVQGALISAGAATIGALSAVRHVFAMAPAEAMRPEPPAQFHRTLMERLGLQRYLSPVWQIIIRNLERKPIQSSLSTLGIAAAIMLLVVGRFSMDAVNYMMDVQFGLIQRDDITVMFNQLRPTSVAYDLLHLPGVLQTEGFRNVPVKLRANHRSYQLALTGLTPETELRQLVDRQLKTVALPLDGLLLTQELSKILAVQPGDMVVAEMLEGNRAIRTVPIVGLVDEMLGLSAYMDLGALNRLMQEGNVISGAMLAVDAGQLDPLYQALKRTPMIASVNLRQATLQRFQETIAQNQAIMNTIQITFSCIIAAGVIYNTARIALSERSRELATLRIIGFSRAQIAVILLGEQAMLTLLAIPIGCGLGYGLAGLLSLSLSNDLYRFPLIIQPASYVFALTVVAIAAMFSGWMVWRNLEHLDLIAVLKTRE